MATIIKIKNTQRFNGYMEVTIELRLDIPTVLNTLPNKKEIAESYAGIYGIDKVDNGYIFFVKVCTFEDGTSNALMQSTFDAIATNYENALSAFALQPFDDMIGKTYDGNTWSYIPPPIPPTP
jgi:hypothetical protein